MIPPTDRLVEELAVFADLGTSLPHVSDESGSTVVRMVRCGEPLVLKFDRNRGAVIECRGEQEIRRASYRALLAGETFANLRGWAGAQQQVLRGVLGGNPHLPFAGLLSRNQSDVGQEVGQEGAASFLGGEQAPFGGVRVLLIDGPAGIGKTRLIEMLAYSRAEQFSRRQEPLILHVKSRGRVLTFLQDLMAFSLQNMRLQVTYDQVPILVRNGLVQLAIDGFDELGDPNGYENAWAQMRDLVKDIEGNGTIILAGRETFIGRSRLLKAIPRLAGEGHVVGVFTLRTVNPNTARRWLEQYGWGPDQFKAANDWDLLENSSYALRPFFLSQLAALGLEKPDYFRSQPPLVMLIESMIDREATKLPDIAERALTTKGTTPRQFVFEVLEEIARDIAETQSEAIDEDTLMWVVDTVLGDGFDQETSRILKNRITALAFLQSDERRGYRRFSHTEFFNYFLSHSAITAICRFEVPKFLRRMIFGSDLLVTHTMVADALRIDRAKAFFDAAEKVLPNAPHLDRGERNIGALVVASVSARAFANRHLANVDIDDAVIRGIAMPSSLRNITVNQLDLREADVSNVNFENVSIVTLIADETTKLSHSFPNVSYVQLQTYERERTLVNQEASDWLDRHGRVSAAEGPTRLVPDDVVDHELVQLLRRVCRVMLRQHWIRTDGDDYATAVVEHPLWNELVEILGQFELLQRRDDLPVSGRPSVFFHIKRAREILSETNADDQIAGFLRTLVRRSREMAPYR